MGVFSPGENDPAIALESQIGRGMMNMKEWKKRKWMLGTAAAVALVLGSPQVQAIGELPDKVSLTAGSNTILSFALPVSARLESGDTQATLTKMEDGVEICAGGETGTAKLFLRLLGLVPVKQVDVEVSDELRLIPGGKSVGIAIETEGLMVVGASDLGNSASPARRAGLKPGDIITQVNGQDVRTAEEFAAQLHPGETEVLTVRRGDETIELQLVPGRDPRDGSTRIGAWVRSSTAGVGTLTFVNPETGEFAALGHAISDIDTGVTLPVAEGGIYESRIVQINRGEKGLPGEIVGDFIGEAQEIGEITDNNDFGIYGASYAGNVEELPYAEGLPIGTRSQMHTGPAQVLTTLDEEVQAFDCEIEHIEKSGSDGMRSIVVHITDDALIGRTGGIVQGMSGSPIIQDGKLIGAVTHVFVNDPTRGYGVGIETMLDAAA